MRAIGQPCGRRRAPMPIASIIFMLDEEMADTRPSKDGATEFFRSAVSITWLDSPCASSASASVRPTSRSEEHTSELQSLMRISYAVFCLKKKKKKNQTT